MCLGSGLRVSATFTVCPETKGAGPRYPRVGKVISGSATQLTGIRPRASRFSPAAEAGEVVGTASLPVGASPTRAGTLAPSMVARSTEPLPGSPTSPHARERVERLAGVRVSPSGPAWDCCRCRGLTGRPLVGAHPRKCGRASRTRGPRLSPRFRACDSAARGVRDHGHDRRSRRGWTVASSHRETLPNPRGIWSPLGWSTSQSPADAMAHCVNIN